MEKIIEISEKDLKTLISHFRDQCLMCDELNIYEFEEGDQEMQKNKGWVDNLEKKLKL